MSASISLLLVPTQASLMINIYKMDHTSPVNEWIGHLSLWHTQLEVELELLLPWQAYQLHAHIFTGER